jgi:hypothetical protein
MLAGTIVANVCLMSVEYIVSIFTIDSDNISENQDKWISFATFVKETAVPDRE